jgi:hypothetical protein
MESLKKIKAIYIYIRIMTLKNIAFQKFNVNKNQRLLTSQQTFNGYI